jgi:hypothetical protein
VKEAVATNFPQSKGAALMGCESDLFGGYRLTWPTARHRKVNWTQPYDSP